MVDIPFPLSTSPGQRPQEGAGRLINVYAEPRGEGIGPVWHRVPGLRIFGSAITDEWVSWSFPFEEWFVVAETPSGASGQYRGGVVVGEIAYVAIGETVYSLTADGGLTALVGTLPGTDKAHFARNNAATPNVVIVVEDAPYEISGNQVIPYSDGDVGSPNSVCFHDGYFMFGYGSGRIQASQVNSVSINALDFTTAESNPDGLTRMISFKGLLYAFGPATIEIYGLPINQVAFPLTRRGYNITPGLITPWALAGHEPEFGGVPIWVASDNTVRMLNDSNPDKISPPVLDALIDAVADKDTIEACCYITKGHPMWQVSCPDWTWVYDLNTQKWHERTSYLLDRSRISLSLYFDREWLFGDTQSSSMLQLDDDLITEDESPLIAQIESAPAKDFPNRVRVARADFDFTVGVGDAQGVDPIETDPSILVSWSDDGGYSWTNPWWRKLGKQAETQQRITVVNTGLSGPMGRRWRLTVSDPVWFGLMGGDMASELRIK